MQQRPYVETDDIWKLGERAPMTAATASTPPRALPSRRRRPGGGGVHGRQRPRTDAFPAGAEEKDQEEEAMSVSDVEEDTVTVVDGEE